MKAEDEKQQLRQQNQQRQRAQLRQQLVWSVVANPKPGPFLVTKMLRKKMG